MLDFKIHHEMQTDDIKSDETFDVVILGGGPAGLSAALYAARAGLNTLLLERSVLGGQIAATALIENCPGCIEGSGNELVACMQRQAARFGARMLYANVVEVDLISQPRTIYTDEGKMLARTVIIATGAAPRKLGVEGEDRFRGKGVSHCATCDGPFYKDKVVAVIGGGDAAVEEASYLTGFAAKVILIHRRDTLRATKAIQDRALANPKIEFQRNSIVEEITGNSRVNGLVVKDVVSGDTKQLAIDGVFIYVGMRPNTNLFVGQLALTSDGYIITDENMQTSLPGVFAAGDVRRTPLRQVITAAADGAVAATYADRYLRERLGEV